MFNSKPAFALALCATTLFACTNPNGTANNTGTGVIVGGVTGATLGRIIGGDDKGALIGGVIGAAAGGAIGNEQDAQAMELRSALAGTDATVTLNGSEIVVNLPESITFNFGSAVVRSAFVPDIAAVSRSMQRYPNTIAKVIGHTDNIGSAAYNQDLSERRAVSVAQIMVNYGTSTSRIRAFGQSFDQPIASNNTAAGRAANRRVEIIISRTR